MLTVCNGWDSVRGYLRKVIKSGGGGKKQRLTLENQSYLAENHKRIEKRIIATHKFLRHDTRSLGGVRSLKKRGLKNHLKDWGKMPDELQISLPRKKGMDDWVGKAGLPRRAFFRVGLVGRVLNSVSREREKGAVEKGGARNGISGVNSDGESGNLVRKDQVGGHDS